MPCMAVCGKAVCGYGFQQTVQLVGAFTPWATCINNQTHICMHLHLWSTCVPPGTMCHGQLTEGPPVDACRLYLHSMPAQTTNNTTMPTLIQHACIERKLKSCQGSTAITSSWCHHCDVTCRHDHIQPENHTSHYLRQGFNHQRSLVTRWLTYPCQTDRPFRKHRLSHKSGLGSRVRTLPQQRREIYRGLVTGATESHTTSIAAKLNKIVTGHQI